MDIYEAFENEKKEGLSDKLRKAMALLGRVKAVHAAAIRNGDAAVSSITSRLLYDIEKLEREIDGYERRSRDGEQQ